MWSRCRGQDKLTESRASVTMTLARSWRETTHMNRILSELNRSRFGVIRKSSSSIHLAHSYTPESYSGRTAECHQRTSAP